MRRNLFWNERIWLCMKVDALASNIKKVNPLKHAVSYCTYCLHYLSKNTVLCLNAFISFV
jgi:hypothetical protein